LRWNWDPRQWKRSTKLLLAFATAWPYVYLILFFGGILAVAFFLDPNQRAGFCGDIGEPSLEHKIRKGELRELVVRPTEILARNRSGTCEYRTWVPDEYTRKEIQRKARELDANGSPLVPQITQEEAPPVSPFAVVGFVAAFAVHMLTIVLLLGLITVYIVLAIKNQQLDQTMKIMWVVGLCMLTMIAMPVYWYMYVWRKPPPARAGTPPQADL